MPNNKNVPLRKITATLLFTLGATLAGCDAVDETTDAEDVVKAQEFRSKGELRNSGIELKNALQKNPDNAEAHRLLGEVNVEFGNGEAAETELRRAMELGVPRDAVLPDLAQALLLQGKYQALLDQIDVPATMKASDGARLMAWRGNAWLGLQKPDKARGDYMAGLLLDSSSALAKLGLARFALAENETDQAFQLIREALESEPANAELWSFQAELYDSQGNSEKAEESFGKAIDLRYANRFDRARRVWVRLTLNKTEAAREDLEVLKKQAPDYFLTHFVQGMMLFKERKLPEAQLEFEQTLKLNEGFVEALYFQGVTNFLQDHLLHAQESLARFNTLSPNTVRGLTMMALVKFKQNEFAEAGKTLLPVIERFPDNVPALRLMGNIELAQGNTAKALEYLGKSVEAGQRSAAAKPAPAGGRAEQGAEELESAMAADSGMEQTEIQIVLIHLQARDYGKAIQAIDRMKSQSPNGILPFHLLARVYSVQGDSRKAEAALKDALKVAPNDLGTLRSLAKFAIMDKQYAAARQYCQTALDSQPHDLLGRLCLAELDELESKPVEMAAELKQAIQDHPEALPPRLALSRVYSRLGQAQRGLDLLEPVRAQFEDDPEFLGRLAEARLENNQSASALEAANRLAKLKPGSALAEYLVAIAQGGNGNSQEMRAALERALRGDPKFLPGRVAMARLLAAEKQTAEAERQLKALLAEYPNNPEVLSLQGWLAMAQRQWGVAESAYRQAMAKAPSSPVVAELARTQWFSGNREGALKTLNDWSGLHPEDAGARYILASFYGELGRQREQRAQFEKAIQIDPEDVLALNDLAWELKLEDPARALGYAERATGLAPESVPVFDTLTMVLIEQAQYDRALELLERAREHWPASTLVRYRLAVAQDRNGGRAEAVKTLRELLAEHPSFAERKDAEELLAKLSPR